MVLDDEMKMFYEQQEKEDQQLRKELRDSELISNLFVERINADVDISLGDIYELVCKSHEEHNKPIPSRAEFIKGQHFSDDYSKSDVVAGIYDFLFPVYYTKGIMPMFRVVRDRANEMWKVSVKD